MRTLFSVCLAATALVAQSSPVIDEPHLAGVLEPLAAAQFLLPLHGFTSAQLAYSPVPCPALRAGDSALYVPDPLLCSASYAGADVAQLVCAVPQGVIVLLDASSSLALHVMAVPAGTWSMPTGICIDGAREQVVLLDSAQPSLLRIALADLRAGNAQFTWTALPSAWSAVRGIAFDSERDRIVGFDPTTGDLLQHTASEPSLVAGSLRPIPAVCSFGFAPAQSLTGGSVDLDLFVTSGDERMMTDRWTWNAATTDDEIATLRTTVSTSTWVPPCPDPAAVTYDALYDRLVVADSEVDEMTIYQGANVFETSRTGVLSRTSTTVAYTPEPSGMTLDPLTRTFYFCDDDKDKIFVVATGPDGLLHTADDSLRSFSVRNFCADAESLAFDPATGTLWIAGGVDNLLHKLRPGANGIFDGTPPNGDDVLASFDMVPFGVTNLGGVALRSADGGIYVLGLPKMRLLHLNDQGQLVRVINLPATSMVRPAGLVFAPSTVGAGDSLYLVDRGHDNDLEPTENDGKMRQYTLPAPVVANQPPIVNAGPDVAALTTSPAHLVGSGSDDGLPSGLLTIQWNPVSGPGTASFTAPTQTATDVSFSAAGSYTLELSAFDGELVSVDTVVVTVTQPNFAPVVDAGPDANTLLTSAAHLAGNVSDDGLQGPLTIQWSKLSGPGTATFTAPNQAVCDVAFSAVGSYTLQLSAFDGELTSADTVVVAVTQANLAPVVNAGPDVSTVMPSAAHLVGTASDDGLQSPLAIQWRKVSGPGTATFTAPAQTVTDVSFSLAGSYTLELSAFDGQLTSTDTVVVTAQPAAANITLNRAISNGNDDAEERLNKIDRSSSTLEMVQDGTVNQVVGLRFTSVTIPKGAVITSAYLQFTTEKVTSIPTQLSIVGQASDNAGAFQTSALNISSRPDTTAGVAWAPAPWTVVGQAGLDQRTPDLASIVQEITNRAGWLSGNAMVFVITGTGCRTATSYNKNHAAAAKLVVTYHM